MYFEKNSWVKVITYHMGKVIVHSVKGHYVMTPPTAMVYPCRLCMLSLYLFLYMDGTGIISYYSMLLYIKKSGVLYIGKDNSH